MRILWLHQYFATPRGWGSSRTYEFARRFVRAGHTVDVVCCAAYDASLEGRGTVTVEPGLRAFVSGTRYRPQMGFVARLAAFARFTVFALEFVRRHGGDYDVLIASSAPLSIAWPALLGHRLHRLPYLFEVIDVWPDAAVAAGVLRNPLAIRAARALEAAAYRHAAHIATCSTGMTDRIVAKGVARARLSTLPNSCDVAAFTPDPARRESVRARLGAGPDHTVCLYTGAMGRSNATGDLFEAIRLTSGDDRIAWWFVGDGPDAPALRALADASGGRVRFIGKVARDDLTGYAAAADVALVTFMHAPLFHENSPNKFFDAIAAGLPVVFNRSTWLEPWLERYGNGVVCRQEPAGPALAAAVTRLAGDPTERHRMGAASLCLAREVFDRDRIAAACLRILEAVAAGKTPAPWSP